MFLLLTAIGPVRDLKCVYNNRLHVPLICEWKRPKFPTGDIPYYSIKITQNSEVIYTDKTNRRFVYVELDLIQDAPYNVTVSPVMRGNVVPATTSVVFHKMSG